MIDIKRLTPYKRVFQFLIETLPIAQMEGDIQQSSDPLISKLYQSVLSADQQICNARYKVIYHNIGIVGTYSLFDVVYGDYVRWFLSQTRQVNLEAKAPEHWRVNEEYLRRQEIKNAGQI